jgi:hypothetical protein
MRVLSLALLLTVLGAGCADPYGDAKKTDTIEAWEAFLATGPSMSQKLGGEQRLEQLMVEKAKASKAVADYDAVLKRFPNSRKKKEMTAERASASFNLAEEAGTTEAWKTFVAENPDADGALKKKAQKRLHALEYAGSVTFSELKVAQVNLAEDPKGALDGWGFSTTVTNTGPTALEWASVELILLDEGGKKLKSVTYPVATTGSNMPIDEKYVKPLGAGEARGWSYSLGEVPEGWKQGAKVVLDDWRAVPAEASK